MRRPMLLTAIAVGTLMACEGDSNPPTATPVLDAGGPLAAAAGNTAPAQECATPGAGWIWCDDFEQDRLARYFEYVSPNGSFARTAAVGWSGSTAMRARFAAGQVSAGNLKLAFGRTPTSYMKPVDAGTANYRDIYWRLYLRHQTGWTGGGGDKLSRATVFAGSNWQQAMIAHVWAGASPNHNYLTLDPASGTDAAGNLKTTKYNDFANLRWLGIVRSTTPIFDAAHVGQWYCVEAHSRLNDAGQSNGQFDLWIDGALEAQKTGLNWLGAYNAYGINTVMVENYWNAGSPVAQERYIDNFVVSTQRIGCGDGNTPPPPPPPSPAPVATVTVIPASATVAVNDTFRLRAETRDADGNLLTDRLVTWTSSNSAVATVSSTGLVRGIAEGTASIVATSEGKEGRSAITVPAPPPAPPPPPGGSVCVNEPANLASITDQPFDEVPPLRTAKDKYGWQVDRNRERLSIIQDPGAPRSPANVIAGKFPAGAKGGTAPFRVERSFNGTRYTTLFMCVWMKHSVNFTDNGNVGTKFSFYRGDGTNHYWGFDGGPDGQDDKFLFFFGLQRGAGNRDFRSTYSATPLGVWRKYEVLTVGNTPGRADGVLRVWVDGQLVVNASDVAYWKSSQIPGFSGFAWEPVYGGGLNPVPHDMYMYVDHWFVSGR